jgi:hypothetical protein
MGPAFQDTFAWIDAMNYKEEKRFSLVAGAFLGPQRALFTMKQFVLLTEFGAFLPVAPHAAVLW